MNTTIAVNVSTDANISPERVAEMIGELITIGLGGAGDMAALLDIQQPVAVDERRVLVALSGGEPADISVDPGVAIEFFNWDNYRAAAEIDRAQMGVPAQFGELASRMGVPVFGSEGVLGPETPTHLVTWRFGSFAETPQAAAQEALLFQRAHTNFGMSYEVRGAGGSVHLVDIPGEEAGQAEAKPEAVTVPVEAGAGEEFLYPKVIVLCKNSEGAAEFFTCTPEATRAQLEEGDHLELAKECAEDNGYEPVMAFDQSDPAAMQMAGVVRWLF